MRRPAALAAPWVLAAVALALRLWGLGRESLWVDEAYTYNATRLGWADIWGLPEQTPPLYLLLMKAWTAVAGTSEWALRFPSALFGAAAVGLAYVVARRWMRPGAAVAAATLLTVAYLPLAYSQEARTYSLLLLLGLASTWALLAAHDAGWRRHGLRYAVLLTLLLYSHVFAVFTALAHAAFVAATLLRAAPPGPTPHPRPSFARAAWPFAAAAAAFLPWTPILLDRAAAVLAHFWIAETGPAAVRAAVGAFGGRGPAGLVTLAALLLAALAAAGAWALLRSPAARREAAALLLPLAVLPVAVPLAMAVAGIAVYRPVYALAAFPFVYLLAGAALEHRRVPSLAAAGLVVLAALFAAQAATLHDPPRHQDYRAVAAHLDTLPPGATVLNGFGFCDSSTTADLQCPLDYYGVRGDLRLVPFIDSYYRPLDDRDKAWLAGFLPTLPEAWALIAGADPSAVHLEAAMRQEFGPPTESAYTGLRVLHFQR